jgi:hypothetical protein
MRNYGATNVAPTQEDKPLLSSKRRPHVQTRKRSWKEHELGHGPDGARNLERLCWRGPAGIYWLDSWSDGLGARQRGQEPLGTEAEESTLLGAVT